MPGVCYTCFLKKFHHSLTASPRWVGSEKHKGNFVENEKETEAVQVQTGRVYNLVYSGGTYPGPPVQEVLGSFTTGTRSGNIARLIRTTQTPRGRLASMVGGINCPRTVRMRTEHREISLWY